MIYTPSMALKRWISVVVVGVAVSVPSLALADRRDDARRYFRRAMARIDAGEPLEAIALLKRAYAARPHPDVLYNIAQLYAEVGQTEDAIEYFERYTNSDPDDKEAVLAAVEDLKQRLAPPPAPPPAPPRKGTAEDIQTIQRSRELMQALAKTTGSDRLRSAAKDLRSLEERLLDYGTFQEPPPPAAPPPATEVSTATSTAKILSSSPRDQPIYDATIVSASRYIQSPLDAPSTTSIITRDEIRASGLTNIGELLRRIPGADVMTNSPSDVNVSFRGFNQRLSNRLLVLVDGRSVYLDAFGNVFWHLLTINVEDVERIEVIRGPASALYGADAFAGVVNIITRLPGQGGGEIVAGGGTHEWLHEHASATGRIGAFGYRLSAGFDNALRFSQELADDRVDHERNISDQELSWRIVRANGALSYAITPDVGLIVRGGVSHGVSGFQSVSGLRHFGMNTEANAFASAQLDTRYGLVRVFYNRIEANGGPQYVRLGADPYQFDLSSATLDVEALFSREFDLLVPQNLQLGGSFRLKQVDWNYLDREREERHFALFVQDTLQFTDWLRFQGSVRVDFHPLLDTPPVSPRGALIFRPTKDSAIRAAAGTAFRTPSFLESYVNVGVNFDVPAVTGTTRGSQVFGRDLKPESILSAELSYMNSESNFFDFEVVGYYSQISNLAPVPIPDPQDRTRLRDINDDPSVEFDPFLGVFAVGDALYRNEDTTYGAFGGEISIRAYPVDGLDAYVNYAYENIVVLDGEASAYRFEDRTSQHKINAGFRYRTPINLDLQADVHFASDQIWSELSVQGSQFDDIRAVSFDLPAYYLINARIAYRLFDDRLELAATGYNVTNNRHRQHPFGQLLGARVLGTVRVKL